MKSIHSIGFKYNGNMYYALVREKTINFQEQYLITIMNGQLELLLYGNHIFIDHPDGWKPEQPCSSKEAEELQQAVLKGLRNSLAHGAAGGSDTAIY